MQLGGIRKTSSQRLLELSMQPTEQLAHWNKIRRYMFTVADSVTIQEIGDYLKSKAAS